MKKTLLLSSLLILLFLLPGCGSQREVFQARSVSDFTDRPMGFLQGGAQDGVVARLYPDHDEALNFYYTSEIDGFAAMESGKIDSYALGRLAARDLLESRPDLVIFPEPVEEAGYTFALKKGDPLTAEVNGAFHTLKDSGEWDELYDKWYGDTPAEKVAGIVQDWPGKNGVLRYWVNVGNPPLAFMGENGEPNGYSVDLVKAVARVLDYRLEITEADFSALIPALQADRADIAGRSVFVTEERKKVIDMTDPFMTDDIVLVVRRENVAPELLEGAQTGETTGFIKDIAESFRKTFIVENRWRLFLQGVGMTLAITGLSALFGTILGFLCYLLFRNRRPSRLGLVRKVTGFLSGIPMVVVLMVFFYILLKDTPFSGAAISVIAFSLLFAISVYNMLALSIGAVDPGQAEAACALGVSDRESFFSILLPQAAVIFLPILKKELVSFLKGTAIVGYIAVQDLTKVTDLVRYRTFDAFFPLIATAFIYYFLGRLLSFLLDRLTARLSWERRSEAEILKGVEL